jgi:glycosyltransferase involved in cell wall biosynthesis
MGKRIKILYTIPNFKTAGSQYVLLSLYNKIDKMLFDPYVCVEKFFETIPDSIPTNRRLVFEFTGNNKKDIDGLRKLLKDNNIDILHSWDYKSNFLEPLSCRFSGVKYLYTKKNNAWSKRWKLKSVLSHYIAYDNPEMKKRFFDSFLFRKKITFVPHGVDVEIFKPRDRKVRQTFNIGCIGNIGANKNQLFIIEALKDLPENVVLHLYGNEEEEYRKLLEEKIFKHNLKSRIHFHGFVENKKLPEVFGNLDVFVLASFQEGMPVSILEALACGIPVLSSDSGGGAKYLLDSDRIFSLKDTDELVLKILEIYHLNEKEMENLAAKEAQNIAQNHTLDKEVRAYERLYKKLVK